jgi:LysM repeat protein
MPGVWERLPAAIIKRFQGVNRGETPLSQGQQKNFYEAMKHIRQPQRILPWTWLLLFLLSVSVPADAIGSSLVYKNYIVRYDRGWDILCEPYVVQKNDWVLKIFRQKGEIAHQNFRDFLGIFERLNPHIRDINMIRPGQGIDIPLRKLEHGTLPGQATGVVTIPFVTLTQVTEVIKAHSQTYEVKKGDTVSEMIARKYGRFGSRSYREGVKLFEAANPQVTDLNRIYAGQRVYLPDPAIREQSFYTAMYDEKGNLRETINQADSAAQRPGPGSTVAGPITPAPLQEKQPQSPLAEAAAAVGGQLHAKGTYYLPRQGGEDFELDLFRHPMLELHDGAKMIFTPSDRIMDMDRKQFQSAWPEIKTVSVDDQTSTEEIIAAIFEALEEKGGEAAEVTFEGPGVHVAVRAKWVRPETDGRHLCITPIAGPDQQTPESIRRFLEQNGVILKEVLPGGGSAALHNEPQRHAVNNILALTPTSQKDFVQILARTLGFTYAANTGITFPYAGIQVQAYADLLAAGEGHETLVDFGDLYGDAIAAIGKTGLNIVQVTTEDSYGAIVQKLLSALGLPFESQPSFLAAPRPAEFNTVITVFGLLYAKSENEHILLTGAPLPAAVTDMLNGQGIDMIVW